MRATVRPYRNETDYGRIRAFLHDVFLANGRLDCSWPAARLDYWRWHVTDVVAGAAPFETVIFIWEASDGQIAAVLNPEGPAEAHLQVHPWFKTPYLEEEMIAVAEERLAAIGADGIRRLWIWAQASDGVRHEILRRRQFEQQGAPAHQHRHPLDAPIPDVPIAPVFTVRPLGGADEHQARCWASWRAFHPDAPDEDYQGSEWYVPNIQRQPLYRRDLDIVAAAPDGAHAAFTTVWFDDATRSAYFEPVGTAPEYQRRGLGGAVLAEGLRRLRRMGAVSATVDGYTIPANALYRSAGFTEYDRYESWFREW
jgi:ribosomal protein S18 acetylase RimI-like enzyme